MRQALRTHWVDQCHPISLLGCADCPPVLFVRYEVQVEGLSRSHNPHREIVPANSNFHSDSHRRASRDSPAGGKYGRADRHSSSLALVQLAVRPRAEGRRPSLSYLPRRAARTKQLEANGLPVCLPGRARPTSKPNQKIRWVHSEPHNLPGSAVHGHTVVHCPRDHWTKLREGFLSRPSPCLGRYCTSESLVWDQQFPPHLQQEACLPPTAFHIRFGNTSSGHLPLL